MYVILLYFTFKITFYKFPIILWFWNKGNFEDLKGKQFEKQLSPNLASAQARQTVFWITSCNWSISRGRCSTSRHADSCSRYCTCTECKQLAFTFSTLSLFCSFCIVVSSSNDNWTQEFLRQNILSRYSWKEAQLDKLFCSNEWTVNKNWEVLFAHF